MAVATERLPQSVNRNPNPLTAVVREARKSRMSDMSAVDWILLARQGLPVCDKGEPRNDNTLLKAQCRTRLRQLAALATGFEAAMHAL